MGPQHCCCGNCGIDLVTSNIEKLQWGRSIAAAEMMIPGTTFSLWMELQWGRSIAAAEIRPVIMTSPPELVLQWGPQHCCCGNSKRAAASRTKLASFNGAAALLLRKCGCGTGADRPSPASMGPQHCCCGNNPIIDRTQVGEKSLQWGRSIAAAEIVAACTLPARGFVASMGPQHCCCGNKRKPIS